MSARYIPVTPADAAEAAAAIIAEAAAPARWETAGHIGPAPWRPATAPAWNLLDAWEAVGRRYCPNPPTTRRGNR